jgi:hypothetical protein
MAAIMVAVLAAGLFAGAAIYVSAVEHPARLSCGPELAVREFAPSCKRGTVMQASLAVLGCVAGHYRRVAARRSGSHRCRATTGVGRAVHPNRHSSNEQPVARSDTGASGSRTVAPLDSVGPTPRGADRLGERCLPVVRRANRPMERALARAAPQDHEAGRDVPPLHARTHLGRG